MTRGQNLSGVNALARSIASACVVEFGVQPGPHLEQRTREIATTILDDLPPSSRAEVNAAAGDRELARTIAVAFVLGLLLGSALGAVITGAAS